MKSSIVENSGCIEGDGYKVFVTEKEYGGVHTEEGYKPYIYVVVTLRRREQELELFRMYLREGELRK